MGKWFAAAALCVGLAGACAPKAQDAAIAGQLSGPQGAVLPAGAVAHIEIDGLAAGDESSTSIAEKDVPVTAFPVDFSLTAPAAKLADVSSLALTARINLGKTVLFTTPGRTIVTAGAPVKVALVGVKPVTEPYTCGTEIFMVSFGPQSADVTYGTKTTTLPVVAPASATPADHTTYSDGTYTFVRKGADVSFAHGKAKPAPCTAGAPAP